MDSYFHRFNTRVRTHYWTEAGPMVEPNALRVWRSDPEGISVQIRMNKQMVTVWLSHADAKAFAKAIQQHARAPKARK
jgi:hypothetical protein